MVPQPPDMAPGPPSSGGFDAVRQAIEEQRKRAPGDHPALYRAASQDILRLLRERGVEDAGTLSAILSDAAKRHPETDLIVVADDYERARSPSNPTEHDAELEKLSRLARVVGTTSQVAVGAAAGGEVPAQMLNGAREVMMQHAGHIGDPAVDTIDWLLNDIEAAGPPNR